MYLAFQDIPGFFYSFGQHIARPQKCYIIPVSLSLEEWFKHNYFAKAIPIHITQIYENNSC